MILQLITFTIGFVWTFWQLKLRLSKWKSSVEPPMLPYLIPWLGHALDFVKDHQLCLLSGYKHFGSIRPFSVVLAGKKTYVISDVADITQTYKKSEELNFDVFVDEVLGLVGVSKSTRMTLWSKTVAETGLSVPNSIRFWVRRALQKGKDSESLYARFVDESHRAIVLTGETVYCPVSGKAFRALRQPEESVSLLEWTGNMIATASTNALLGAKCLEVSPTLLSDFQIFNHGAWMLLFQYPKFLSKPVHSSMERLIAQLTGYFDLPEESRPGAAPFVYQSEREMRRHGVSSRDIAAIIFQLFWASSGNPSVLGFWLLSHIIHDPALLAQVRAEALAAFKGNSNLDTPPDVTLLLNASPAMNAAYHEATRLYGGTFTFRRVKHETEVQGYRLKVGHDMMIPYQQLHLHGSAWGPVDPKHFDSARFRDCPHLAKTRHLKPFGGGTTLCPGRFLAQQTALTFVATAVARFEFEVVGGAQAQPFPKVDRKLPTIGVASPGRGEDLRVRIRVREVEGVRDAGA